MTYPPFDSAELRKLVEELCNDEITPARHLELCAMLRDNPDACKAYFEQLEVHLGLAEICAPMGDLPRLPREASRKRWFDRVSGLAIAASVLMVAGFAIQHWMGVRSEPSSITKDGQLIVMAQAAGAKFLGETGPANQSLIPLRKAYVLLQGSVEWKSPNGATAIFTAPAIFSATGPERIFLKSGICSVSAPQGAEGFTVDTPLSKIVDRGTRFLVEINGAGRADVHVIEGLADIYAKESIQEDDHNEPASVDIESSSGFSSRYRVRASDAFRIELTEKVEATSIQYDATAYQYQLPDRLVSFDVKEDTRGRATELSALTIQRGGRRFQYDASELIGIELTHFRTSDSRSLTDALDEKNEPLMAPGQARAGLLDGDFRFCTGVVNIGGSGQPPEGEYVLEETEGMAIRFRTPIVNCAGPDLVLFEMQSVLYPIEGDQFFVIPCPGKDDLRPHRVSAFDIDLASPHVRECPDFVAYEFREPPESLDQLLHGDLDKRSFHITGTRCLGVGIDLSDLGYEIGAVVEQLMFQDAVDNEHRVDPVLIVGLPAS